jgi:photosystem II stability/assembly factor-like uncharacterized protein
MRKIPLAFILLATVFQSGLLAHQPHDPMAVIAASPNFANDKIVLAATSYLTVSIGVYLPLLSTDGGVSWTPLEGFPNLAITAIRFSPSFSTDGTAFMSGGGGLFRSSNMGSNWSQISVGGGHPILDMAISPNFLNDGTMFAISTAGLYESTDHGNTFETLSAPVSSAWFSVCAISTNFTADHIFTIGDDQGNIFETTNGGALWTNLTAGLGLAQISRIIFTPAFSAYPIILVGTNGTGVYASQDAGSTWSATNSGITDLNVTDLALYPDYTSLGTALITTKSAGVFISKNRGRAWTLTSLPNRPLSPQTQTHFVTLAPATTSANTAIVFLGMFEGTWTTTNQGTSWTYVNLRRGQPIHRQRGEHVGIPEHGLLERLSRSGGIFPELRCGSYTVFRDSDGPRPNDEPRGDLDNGARFRGQQLSARLGGFAELCGGQYGADRGLQRRIGQPCNGCVQRSYLL